MLLGVELATGLFLHRLYLLGDVIGDRLFLLSRLIGLLTLLEGLFQPVEPFGLIRRETVVYFGLIAVHLQDLFLGVPELFENHRGYLGIAQSFLELLRLFCLSAGLGDFLFVRLSLLGVFALPFLLEGFYLRAGILRNLAEVEGVNERLLLATSSLSGLLAGGLGGLFGSLAVAHRAGETRFATHCGPRGLDDLS